MTPDRRAHARRPVSRPCKLYHPASRRYTPATTLDLSAGGVLVGVEPWRVLAPGDTVTIAIAAGPGEILPAAGMVPARVVRAHVDGAGRQALGLSFDRPIALAA